MKYMWQKIINRNFVKIFWALFYVLVFIILLRGGFSYLDPDLGWHLQAGKTALIEQAAGYYNNYNFTYVGTWVNHEWLSDILLYLLYDKLGYTLVVFIFTSIIVSSLIFANFYVYRTAKVKPSIFIRSSLLLLGTLAAMPSFGVRIQELTFLFALLLLVILDDFNKRHQWQILLFLPPIFTIWANLHAGFLMGLMLMWIWLVIKVAENLIKKYFSELSIFNKISLHNQLSWSKIKIALLMITISSLATLVNVYGFQLYNFLSSYKNKAYLSYINEWLPQHTFPLKYWQLFYLALGVIALILYIYRQLSKKNGLELWSLFLVTIFIILSWQSTRHFPLFFISSFPLMISVFSDHFSGCKINFTYHLKFLVLSIMLVVICWQLIALNLIKDPFKSFCHSYPCQAVNFLRDNQQYEKLNLFNHYDWGGFLIWSMPERKIFIDGRLPQVKFGGKTFIEEYNYFFKADTNYERSLEKYNIRLVMIKSKTKVISFKKWEQFLFNLENKQYQTTNYLQEYLNNSNNWKIIHQDEVASIYLKM